MDIFGQPTKPKFSPGAYVMTQAITDQDKRVLVSDIVAYSILNKVPAELSNKILVEKYIDSMRAKIPESVLTYISQHDWSRRPVSIPSMFVYIDDPKGGPPIEYPIRLIEEFFSF